MTQEEMEDMKRVYASRTPEDFEKFQKEIKEIQLKEATNLAGNIIGAFIIIFIVFLMLGWITLARILLLIAIFFVVRFIILIPPKTGSVWKSETHGNGMILVLILITLVVALSAFQE